MSSFLFLCTPITSTKAVDYGVELCFFGFVFYFSCYAFKNLSVFGRKQSLVCIIFLLLLEDRNTNGFVVA